MSVDQTLAEIKGLATHALYLSGTATAARYLLSARGRFALTFHGIARGRPKRTPRAVQPHLTVQDLRAILTWLQGRFELLTPREFLASRKRGVLLTFDDGFANNAVNALPVLAEFGAPAVFFVSTQHVASPRDWLESAVRDATAGWGGQDSVPAALASDFYGGMSVVQLQECADHSLITIGSHTVSHPLLTTLPNDLLRVELSESRGFLERTIGRAVELFAYPYGDYDRRVAEAVATAGYRAAFVLDTRKLGVSRFEVPRVGIYSSKPAYLAGKLSGLHRPALRAAVFED